MSKKIIILEGSKGSGKSTLALEVVTQLQFMGYTAEYFKKGVRDNEDEYKNMINHIHKFVNMPCDFVVVDRFHVTEYVMSLVHGRVELSKLVGWTKDIANELNKLDALVYVLDVSIDNILERLEAREDVNRRVLDMEKEIVEFAWQMGYLITPHALSVKNNTQEEFEEAVKRIYHSAISESYGY